MGVDGAVGSDSVADNAKLGLLVLRLGEGGGPVGFRHQKAWVLLVACPSFTVLGVLQVCRLVGLHGLCVVILVNLSLFLVAAEK